MITSIREELERLRDKAGFWIGEDVYMKALRSSKEERD